MLVNFVENLLKQIRQRQDNVKNTLASNSVSSFEQYKHLVGKVQGLEEAIAVCEEIYNKMVENRLLVKSDT